MPKACMGLAFSGVTRTFIIGFVCCLAALGGLTAPRKSRRISTPRRRIRRWRAPPKPTSPGPAIVIVEHPGPAAAPATKPADITTSVHAVVPTTEPAPFRPHKRPHQVAGPGNDPIQRHRPACHNRADRFDHQPCRCGCVGFRRLPLVASPESFTAASSLPAARQQAGPCTSRAAMAELDVDVTAISGQVKPLDGSRVTITGRLKEKNWVERGKTGLLIAETIAVAPLPDMNK